MTQEGLEKIGAGAYQYEINETTGFFLKGKSSWAIEITNSNMPKEYANENLVTHKTKTATLKEAIKITNKIDLGC